MPLFGYSFDRRDQISEIGVPGQAAMVLAGFGIAPCTAPEFAAIRWAFDIFLTVLDKDKASIDTIIGIIGRKQDT